MNALRLVVVVAALWLLVAGFLVVEFWPQLPRTGKQWAIFVGLGPPTYVALEGAFGWLFSRRHGEAISAKQFSIARVLVALLVVVSVVGTYWWLSSYLVGE